MKKLVVKKLIYAVLMSLVVMLFAACGSDGNKAATAAKTTVMVYIEGTDLEDDNRLANYNIIEMLASDLAPHVNLVLTTGAANKAVAVDEYDQMSDWTTVKRHQVRYNDSKQDNEIIELEDLGKIDMGDPKVLTDFIVWGQNNFPTDQYVLIFWDHGGGPNRGFGGYHYPKTETPTSSLSVPMLRKAVADAVSTTGKQLELVGFDACLMGSSELALSLKPYAKYFVASEENEGGRGWDYTYFLEFIANNHAADGLEIGKAIADGFAAKNQEYDDESYTLSVVELSKLDALVNAIDQFSEIVLAMLQPTVNDGKPEGFTSWNLLSEARNQADEYGTAYATGNFPNLIDIGHFARLLESSPDSIWHEPAKALQSAVDQAVRYKVSGAEHGVATGLSIFFPFNDLQESQKSMLAYSAVPLSARYYQAMSTYLLLPLQFDKIEADFGENKPTLVDDHFKINVSSPYGISRSNVGIMTNVNAVYDGKLKLVGMDLAEYSKTEGNTYELSYDPGKGLFYLDNQEVAVFFESKLSDGRYVLSVPVYYRDKGSDSKDDNRLITLRVLYDPASNCGEIKSGWEGFQPDGMAPRYFYLERGARITPAIQTIDINTLPETVKYILGQEITLTSYKLEFSRKPVPPGDYLFAFQVRDLAGRSKWSQPVDYTVPPAQ